MSRQQSARGERVPRHTGRPMRARQRGMTMIGLLCILALVGAIGYAGLRLVPVYLNYLKVARSMDVTAAEFKGETADQEGIRRSLEKHWQIEDISSVDSKEVEIVKNEGVVTMHVVYDDAVPYVSNISLSVHFDKTVRVQ